MKNFKKVVAVVALCALAAQTVSTVVATPVEEEVNLCLMSPSCFTSDLDRKTINI